MNRDKHLSADRMRLLTEGQLLLRPVDILHIESCDECSEEWWKGYLDAKRRRKNEEGTTA